MRVDDSKPAAPARSAPDRARFQQALQQTGARPRSPPSRMPDAPGKPTGALPSAATPKPGAAGAPKPGATGAPQPGASAPKPGAAGAPKPSAPLPSMQKPGALGPGKPSAAPQPTPRATVATGQAVAHARSALATPENLGRVRQGMNAESHRLQNTRAEAQSVAHERTEHRVTELIARELTRDLRPEPASAPGAARPASPPSVETERGTAPEEASPSTGEVRMGAASAGVSSPEAPDAQLKAQAALELIERIEVFVKSQRPALKMSLGGALNATVEVERTGPREVALRIQGRQGPVPSEELSRIREALEAKGLRLRSLVAG